MNDDYVTLVIIKLECGPHGWMLVDTCRKVWIQGRSHMAWYGCRQNRILGFFFFLDFVNGHLLLPMVLDIGSAT